MIRNGIHFDELIRHRINKLFIIDLFTTKQKFKKKSILRTSLHNQTINNLHKIYEFSAENANNPQTFYPDTYILDPSPPILLSEPSLCFIEEDRIF